jgi:hypothetical protein
VWHRSQLQVLFHEQADVQAPGTLAGILDLKVYHDWFKLPAMCSGLG